MKKTNQFFDINIFWHGATDFCPCGCAIPCIGIGDPAVTAIAVGVAIIL